MPIGFYRDSFGNVCGRLVAPAGGVTLRGDALVRDSGLPDVVMPTAQQLPIDQLPDEVLLYLMPSRYCETDKLTDVAWSLFGNTPPGWARVQAIVDFVHNHVTFGYQHAHHMKSAHDVYEQRAGVCRDFAHLALTFCRCMNIPARYCTGYLGDIGVPRDPAPMDFSGWFQVYLSGQWYTFDARHNVPAHRPHPDGHRPRRRRRRADHELRPDGSGEVFRHQRRGRAGLTSLRHCERCEAIHARAPHYGLLRCARNDIETMISDRLFVYGTLMRGFDHPMAQLLSRSADYLGPATCRGRLYLIKHYPGLVLSDDPTDIVFGELYRLRDRDALLGEFDMYEACGEGFPEPTEYIRRMLQVTHEDGAASEAWTYVYNWPVTGLPQIASGKFLEQ